MKIFNFDIRERHPIWWEYDGLAHMVQIIEDDKATFRTLIPDRIINSELTACGKEVQFGSRDGKNCPRCNDCSLVYTMLELSE